MEKIRNEASRKMKKPLSPSLSSLMKTLQWLPISLRVKAKVSTMDSKVKCNLTSSSTPLPLWLHLLLSSLSDHSSLATLASAVAKEHAKPVLASEPVPFPLSGLIFPYIPARLSPCFLQIPSKFTCTVSPSLTTPFTTATLPSLPALPVPASCFFHPQYLRPSDTLD